MTRVLTPKTAWFEAVGDADQQKQLEKPLELETVCPPSKTLVEGLVMIEAPAATKREFAVEGPVIEAPFEAMITLLVVLSMVDKLEACIALRNVIPNTVFKLQSSHAVIKHRPSPDTPAVREQARHADIRL